MKLTIIGKDIIIINEENLGDKSLEKMGKIHLIKLNFSSPSREKIFAVIDLFPKTNRFIISNNIKIYNDVLKTTTKKYYVENENDTPFISFLRKNNKILLNFGNLGPSELSFLSHSNILYDLLKNIEVIKVSQSIYLSNINVFDSWDGNVIIDGG